MKFKKQIRQVGSAIGIFFTRQEEKIHNIKIGDYLDLSDVVIIKKKQKK